MTDIAAMALSLVSISVVFALYIADAQTKIDKLRERVDKLEERLRTKA